MDRRLAPWAKAMIRTIATKITGMQKNGAAENRKGLGNPTREDAMTRKAPRITTIATTMSPILGGRPAAAGYQLTGGIDVGGATGDGGSPEAEGARGGCSTIPD